MGWKLAVLGGGPAGLQSALTGALKGFNVTLFEKKKIGENFCCGEGFYDSFKIFSPPSEGICFEVKNLILKVKNTYNLDFTGLNIWMLDREKWQKHFANVCVDKGVEIKENTKILSKDLDKLKREFDWIIDASGVSMLSSKYYNLSHKYKRNFARAYQVTLNGDFSFLNDSVMVGTEPHYHGYYWIFPKGDNTANVGVGFFKKEKLNLKQELIRILEKEEINNYEIIKEGGGHIPTRVLERLVYENIVLVGDSAGLASPLHGGGIDLALISGDLAVKSIYESNMDENKELNYEKKLMELIGKRLELENKLVSIWSELGYDGLDELLKLLLNRKSLTKILKLFKYRSIITWHKDDLNDFYKGFFEGEW